MRRSHNGILVIWGAGIIVVFLQTVQIGHRNENEAEVLRGLGEGDVVVRYPNDSLRDGSRVNIQN